MATSSRPRRKITVGISEAAADALDYLSHQTQLTNTDVINRALTLYRLVHNLSRADGSVQVRNGDAIERIHLL